MKKRVLSNSLIKTFVLLIVLFTLFFISAGCNIKLPTQQFKCCIINDVSTGTPIGCIPGSAVKESASVCSDYFYQYGNTEFKDENCNNLPECSGLQNCAGVYSEAGIDYPYLLLNQEYRCGVSGTSTVDISYQCINGVVNVVEDCSFSGGVCDAATRQCSGIYNYLGDADGDREITSNDLSVINIILNEQPYMCNNIPNNLDCKNLDLDGNDIIGVPDKNIISLILEEGLTNVCKPSSLQVVNKDEDSITLKVVGDSTSNCPIEFVPRAGIAVCVGNCDELYSGDDVSFDKKYSITDSNGEVTFDYIINSEGEFPIIFNTLESNYNNLYIPSVSREVTFSNIPACIPDCTNKCSGWDDGCYGLCVSDAPTCIDPYTGKIGVCRDISGLKYCKDQNLVLEYSFSQAGAIDTSGSGNNGTVSGATYLTTGGILGGAYQFDGSDDYIRIPDSPSTRIQGSWSITSWVNLATLPLSGKQMTIIGKGYYSESAGYNHNYLLGIENGAFGSGRAITILVENTAGKNYVARMLITPNLNKWYYVAGVYDDTANNLYIYVGDENGIQSVSSTASLTSDVGSACSTIGIGCCDTLNPAWDIYLKGNLDEMKVYNKPLTMSEIMEICREADPSMCPS